MGAEQAFALEPREKPAHCLERKAEITSNLLARHTQAEACRRIAEPLITLGKAEEERGDALFGIHAAQQKHKPLVARNVAAQNAQQTRLQVGKAQRKLRESRIRDDADFTVFERDGVVSMIVRYAAITPCSSVMFSCTPPTSVL